MVGLVFSACTWQIASIVTGQGGSICQIMYKFPETLAKPPRVKTNAHWLQPKFWGSPILVMDLIQNSAQTPLNKPGQGMEISLKSWRQPKKCSLLTHTDSCKMVKQKCSKHYFSQWLDWYSLHVPNPLLAFGYSLHMADPS